MKLEVNAPELENLMKDFHLLTGIRIVLFDNECHELFSYPKSHCHFCQMMKSADKTRRLCEASDRASFEKCRERNELILYHCHAGLIEAAAPLREQNTVIGYMMFGQISDASNENELFEIIKKSRPATQAPAAPPELSRFTGDIPLKSREQIEAAAKIMEACTFYVILKNAVRLRRNNFIHNMDQFLCANLSGDLSVEAIAKELGISKTKLYDVCNLYYGHGIAEHVRSLRIETAKRLLTETDRPITAIADAVGFADYNYFCRVFKRVMGMPAGKYRDSRGGTVI